LLGIPRTEIARRYGCAPQFIHSVFSGKYRCPPDLDRLIRQMIAERGEKSAAIFRTILLDERIVKSKSRPL
jgi:hypothetical protein